MMFSAINEAFDNPIKEQINNYDLDNNNCNHNYNHNYDQNDNYKTFFNAQGDMTDNLKMYQGTSIKSLQKIQNEAIEEFEDDTLYTDTLSYTPPEENIYPQHSHQYYINKFLKTIDLNDDVSDLHSLLSSTDRDSEIMKHIRDCKYCKKIIIRKVNTVEKKETEIKNNKKLDFINTALGYEFREILIIILIGILIIFVLDLFFRFGQRAAKI